MKTPNNPPIVPGMSGPLNNNDDNGDYDNDDDDADLRALTSVDLDDDAPRRRADGHVFEHVADAGAMRQKPKNRPRRQKAGSKERGLTGHG